MTMEAMAWAWEQKVCPEAKLLLLYLADNFGENPFDPGLIQEQAARRTNLSASSVASLWMYLYAVGCTFSCEHGQLALFLPGKKEAYQNKQDVQEAAQEKPKKLDPGFVYLLCASTGYYKIGRAKEPANRLRTFGVQLPFEVEYEHLIASENYHDLEASLHELFADRRVNGEWFALAPEDVSYIKSLGGAS